MICSLLNVSFFSIPHTEPNQRYDGAECAERITYGRIQVHGLWTDKNERGAHRSHEQRRDERDDIGFLLADEIHGNGPQSEYRESLVAPSEVLPNGVEAIGVLHLPYQ